MFNLGQAVDLFSDVTGNKARTARLIKFFQYKEGGMGIAFFDNQTIHGEYWNDELLRNFRNLSSRLQR